MHTVFRLLFTTCVLVWLPRPAAPAPQDSTQDAAASAETFEERVPGTTTRIDLVPVPALEGGAKYWMATTEIPWQIFDAFVYQLDLPHDERGAVLETRPTKPYVMVDRGYGHNGYPALSMSFKGAQSFCVWLSEKTGRSYRLPTEAEFENACRAGTLPTAEYDMTARAWFKTNSKGKTQKIAKREPDGLGLFDLYGNVGEWCVTTEGTGVVRGGSFRDETVGLHNRLEPTPAWNATDPQLPKSPWWLADADFVGFRVVCDDVNAGESKH